MQIEWQTTVNTMQYTVHHTGAFSVRCLKPRGLWHGRVFNRFQEHQVMGILGVDAQYYLPHYERSKKNIRRSGATIIARTRENVTFIDVELGFTISVDFCGDQCCADMSRDVARQTLSVHECTIGDVLHLIIDGVVIQLHN